MKEHGAVRFRAYGDKHKAERLLGIGRKLLGEMKSRMLNDGNEVGKAQVTTETGVVYQVFSNMLGLADNDEIRIYVPGGKELKDIPQLDICLGFIAVITSEKLPEWGELTGPNLPALTNLAPINFDEVNNLVFPDQGAKYFDTDDDNIQRVYLNANGSWEWLFKNIPIRHVAQAEVAPDLELGYSYMFGLGQITPISCGTKPSSGEVIYYTAPNEFSGGEGVLTENGLSGYHDNPPATWTPYNPNFRDYETLVQPALTIEYPGFAYTGGWTATDLGCIRTGALSQPTTADIIGYLSAVHHNKTYMPRVNEGIYDPIYDFWYNSIVDFEQYEKEAVESYNYTNAGGHDIAKYLDTAVFEYSGFYEFDTFYTTDPHEITTTEDEVLTDTRVIVALPGGRDWAIDKEEFDSFFEAGNIDAATTGVTYEFNDSGDFIEKVIDPSSAFAPAHGFKFPEEGDPLAGRVLRMGLLDVMIESKVDEHNLWSLNDGVVGGEYKIAIPEKNAGDEPITDVSIDIIIRTQRGDYRRQINNIETIDILINVGVFKEINRDTFFEDFVTQIARVTD